MTSPVRHGNGGHTLRTWLCVGLLATCLVTDVVAGRKLTGSSSKTKSRSSSSSSSARQQPAQKKHEPNQEATRLSYSPSHASAPALPAASAGGSHAGAPAAGWNVPQQQQRQNVPHSQSAPYPSQNGGHAPYAQGVPAQSAPYPQQSAAGYPQASGAGHAPPPYSPYGGGSASHAGQAPPPYSPYGNANPHVPAGAPPPYSAHGVQPQQYPGE